MGLQMNVPTLDRLFDQATTQFSLKEALIYNDVSVTYNDLRQSVENLDKGLMK
jgi:hypothetical protein